MNDQQPQPVVLIPATTSVNAARAMNAATSAINGNGAGGKKSKRQKKNAKKKQNKGGDKNVPFVKDVQNTVESVFGDSNKLIWICIAVAVILSHKQNVSEGFLGSYLAHDNNVSRWVVSNTQKALGLVCFVPVAMMAREEIRMKIFMAIIAGALAAPALDILTYAAIAVATHIALNVRSKTNRMYILIGCVLMAYFKVDVSGVFHHAASPVQTHGTVVTPTASRSSPSQ